MINKVIYTIIFAIFLLGCAGTSQKVSQIGEVQGSAKIIVNRMSSDFGDGVSLPVFDDSIYIGDLGPEGSLSWTRPEGVFYLEVKIRSSIWDEGSPHTFIQSYAYADSTYEFEIGYGPDPRQSYMECFSHQKEQQCRYPYNQKIAERLIESPNPHDRTLVPNRDSTQTHLESSELSTYQNPTKEDDCTGFWVSMGAGFGFGAGLLATAPLLESPQVKNVFLVALGTGVLNGALFYFFSKVHCDD